jgi:hypothetical protein
LEECLKGFAKSVTLPTKDIAVKSEPRIGRPERGSPSGAVGIKKPIAGVLVS